MVMSNKVKNLQKYRSKLKLKLELQQSIIWQNLKKARQNIKPDHSVDQLGYLLSNDHIDKPIYDVLRDLEKVYCLIYKPNLKAQNYAKNIGNGMSDSDYAKLEYKLKAYQTCLGKKNWRNVIDVIVYNKTPDIKAFKQSIVCLFV